MIFQGIHEYSTGVMTYLIWEVVPTLYLGGVVNLILDVDNRTHNITLYATARKQRLRAAHASPRPVCPRCLTAYRRTLAVSLTHWWDLISRGPLTADQTVGLYSPREYSLTPQCGAHHVHTTGRHTSAYVSACTLQATDPHSRSNAGYP